MLDYICYDSEFLREIVSMYLMGVPVASIAMYMGVAPEQVNDILDYFAPYLG